MLIHPQFDPVAIHIGSFSVHWYGLMYLLAFVCFMLLGRRRIHQGLSPLNVKQLDDALTYGILGVVIGGRLGQVLFYEPAYFLSHPLEIFMLWHGGMSFHGGFIGVLVAAALLARKHKINIWDLTDFIAPLVPLGLAAGRWGNFINGELWGRIASADLPWAMLFPQAQQEDLLTIQQQPDLITLFNQYGALPRHPSQLYELALEGLVLFAILWFYSRKARPRGATSALFLIGYGLARTICEHFRTPDDGIFGLSYTFSMGQWLSLPMIIIGAIWFFYIKRHASTSQPSEKA